MTNQRKADNTAAILTRDGWIVEGLSKRRKMEAKDTVMSDEQLDDIGYPILPIGDRTGNRRVAKKQAEISFKAGRDSLLHELHSPSNLISAARQEGMREVVEWLQRTRNYSGDYFSWIIQEQEAWQSKLKEWGIK